MSTETKPNSRIDAQLQGQLLAKIANALRNPEAMVELCPNKREQYTIVRETNAIIKQLELVKYIVAILSKGRFYLKYSPDKLGD